MVSAPWFAYSDLAVIFLLERKLSRCDIAKENSRSSIPSDADYGLGLSLDEPKIMEVTGAADIEFSFVASRKFIGGFRFVGRGECL